MKLVIFDLDGVLIEAKEIHFNALNQALEKISPEYVISWEDHLRTFDGMKTLDKLNLLKVKGLPLNDKLVNQIFNDKQTYTTEALTSLKINEKLITIFEKLKSNSFKIACCSNSVKNTVEK